jgi:hypothetical protein
MILHFLELKTTQDYQRMNLHAPCTNLDLHQVVRKGQKHYVEQQQRNLEIYLATQGNLV